jgi:hypothetical protein
VGEPLPGPLAERVAHGWVVEDFGALVLSCERNSVPGMQVPTTPQDLSRYEHLANHTHLEDVLPAESPYDPIREARLAFGWARALLATAFAQTGCRCTALIQVGGEIERGVVWVEQRRPGIDLHDIELGGGRPLGYQAALAVVGTDDAELDDAAVDIEWRRAAAVATREEMAGTGRLGSTAELRSVELGANAAEALRELLQFGHALGPTLAREPDLQAGSLVALVGPDAEIPDLQDLDARGAPGFDWVSAVNICRPTLKRTIRKALTPKSVVIIEDSMGSASRNDPFLDQWPGLRFVTCTSRRGDVQAGRVVVALSAAETMTTHLDDALTATTSKSQTVAVCDWGFLRGGLGQDLTERRLASLARRTKLVAVTAYSGAGLAIWTRRSEAEESR